MAKIRNILFLTVFFTFWMSAPAQAKTADYDDLIQKIQQSYDSRDKPNYDKYSLYLLRSLRNSSAKEKKAVANLILSYCSSQDCRGLGPAVFMLLDGLETDPAVSQTDAGNFAASLRSRISSPFQAFPQKNTVLIGHINDSYIHEISSTLIHQLLNSRLSDPNLTLARLVKDAVAPPCQGELAGNPPSITGLPATNEQQISDTGPFTSRRLDCLPSTASSGNLAVISVFDCDDQTANATLEPGELAQLIEECLEASMENGNRFGIFGASGSHHDSSTLGARNQTGVINRGGDNWAVYRTTIDGKVYTYEYSMPANADEGEKHDKTDAALAQVDAEVAQDEANEAENEAKDAQIDADNSEAEAQQADAKARADAAEAERQQSEEARLRAEESQRQADEARQKAEEKKAEAEKKKKEAEEAKKAAEEAKKKAEAEKKKSGLSGQAEGLSLDRNNPACQEVEAIFRRGQTSMKTLKDTKRPPMGPKSYPVLDDTRPGAEGQNSMSACGESLESHFPQQSSCDFQHCSNGLAFSWEQCSCVQDKPMTQPVFRVDEFESCTTLSSCPGGMEPYWNGTECDCRSTGTDPRPSPLENISAKSWSSIVSQVRVTLYNPAPAKSAGNRSPNLGEKITFAY